MQTDMMWQRQDLESLLTERFHMQTGFQPGQRELIERLLQGERILAIQHRGWRHALCYQVASICLPHLTLVFSPLKELLRDQCRRSNNCYGIPSRLVSADKSLEENRATFTQAMAGNIKILFLAPERLDSIGWQKYIAKIKISLFVIEQAHCVSTWSHDFRLHYQKIPRVIDELALGLPVLMLTEAANKRVEVDVLQQFCTTNVSRSSLKRFNLCLHVVRLNGDWEKLCYLATVLQCHKDGGIIYAATRGSAMMIAFFLCSHGIEAVYEDTHHDDGMQPGIELGDRINQHSVLCMVPGQDNDMDSVDIRFVIHYHAPTSLIDYYHDISRTAQNDDRTWCILLYDPADVVQQERHVGQDGPQEKHYVEVLSLLQAHSQGTHENNLLLNTGLSHSQLSIILGDLLEQGLVMFRENTRRYTLTPGAFSGKSRVLVNEESNMVEQQARAPAIARVSGTGHRLQAIRSQRNTQSFVATRINAWKEGVHHEQGITGECIHQVVDFSIYERIRRKKLEELVALQQYTHTAHCYMAYLCNYLGDEATGYDRCGICSNCSRSQFPDVHPTQRIQMAVTQFLAKDFLPCIERQETEERNAHEAGWSLSYHDGSRIGEQVHASKYQGAGPFPLGLVLRATEIAQTRYPVQDFDVVVSIPPSESGPLVEQFARQIANRLGKEYFAGFVKTRPTYVQKRLSNRVQKANNLRGAFAVIEPNRLVKCTILLIDDIYDSGCTLYEAGKTLMEAGAQAVYPLTITRALQMDHEQGGMV